MTTPREDHSVSVSGGVVRSGKRIDIDAAVDAAVESYATEVGDRG